MGENEQLYQERLNRYVTALYNGTPDRVPIRVLAEELAAKHAGYSNFEAAVDHELQFEVNRNFAVDLGVDAIQTNPIVNWIGMQKAIGWKGIRYPGVGLPENSCTQWTEPATEDEAFLKADEYDEFAEDPTAFLINRWLPRFTDHVQPYGESVTFTHNMSLVNGVLAHDLFFDSWKKAHGEPISSGVVPAVGSVLKAPLDILGDKLRGYINLCHDLLDRRDKVIAACKALMSHLFEVVAAGADPYGNIPSIIWMHRGCVPFISRQDFQEIYWPTLRPMIEELRSRGSQLVLYAEGDWTPHLEAFTKLPEKNVIFHADKTDVFRTHEILGRKFCISGGISNELLARGTPDQVRACCKDIIDGLARDGGYILDAVALLTDDAGLQNFRAMIEFTKEYDVYGEPDRSSLDDVKTVTRPLPKGFTGFGSTRPAGVCFPWEEKRASLPAITTHEDRIRHVWESIDRMGYLFYWVNLTW
jgi:uroporphyrinogen-III decarboxylase